MENVESVKSLNSLLRGEKSALETYRQVMEKVTGPASAQLQECKRSHEQRIRLLTERIQQLGGQPAEGSGAWGAFAKLVAGGAKLFGEKSAVAALEEGEDHGLKDYRSELSKLDPDSRTLVERDLLPEAEKTHGTLSTLKHTIH